MSSDIHGDSHARAPGFLQSSVSVLPAPGPVPEWAAERRARGIPLLFVPLRGLYGATLGELPLQVWALYTLPHGAPTGHKFQSAWGHESLRTERPPSGVSPAHLRLTCSPCVY